MINENFIRLIKSFDKHQVNYILIGGLALILHGYSRFTDDIDFFIEPENNNIQRLREALKEIYNDDSISEITLDELDKYAVIRYGTPDNFNIDIITRLGEENTFESIKYDLLELFGEKVKVATAEALIKLKKGTNREKDRQDILFLKNLIEKRGKNASI